MTGLHSAPDTDPALSSGDEAAGGTSWSIDLADEAATEALARFVADEVRQGDLVTLSGDLGTGKSTFARALIRSRAGDPALEVPSPTFTLLQTYQTDFGPVVHADFYRLNGPGELIELGFEEAAADALTIVEWPRRAAAALKPDRLDITLRMPEEGPDGARVATLTGRGPFAGRLALSRAVREVLAGIGWVEAARTHVQGDASTRAYERLTKPGGETAILMISPRRPDGPPVRRGKPYSAIAKLAESVHAFVAIAQGLRERGFSAPATLASDLQTGLVLIEDLGHEPITDIFGPMPDRYTEAARAIAALQAMELPSVLPVAEGQEHRIPVFDLEALLIEVELLLDWFAPHIARVTLPAVARASFVAAWAEVLAEVLAAPVTWTLRDYHSPNLLWLEEREGIGRIGMLDFQDAVLGHPAYDAVSLMQDARVTIPADLELKLLGAYAAARQEANLDFDFPGFARAYAILGAQRATKLLGIFTRLERRDGKPQYLRHLPRIEAYLARNLTHPVLSSVKLWYETHLPRALPAALEPEA